VTSLQPYTAYKDSGVEWLGMIPVEWDALRIKMSVQSARNGIWGQDPQDDESPVWCVRVADFDRNSQTVDASVRTMRSVTPDELMPRRLNRGDLLLEKSGGGENNPVGFVVRFDHDEVAVCSNFVAKVQLGPGMDSRFWTYVHATTYSVRLTQRSIKQTSGIQNLDQASYFNELAPFPPSETQSRIADFLDRETAQIDDLIGKQERLIKLLTEKRQAIITHAVTKGLDPTAPTKPSGVPWQGSVPEHWSVQPLKNMMRMQTGVTLGKNFAQDVTETYAYLRVANVQIGYVDLTDVKEIDLPPEVAASSMLQPGDVLMTEGGDRDKLARGCIWDGSISPCVHQNHIFAVRTAHQLLSSFLVLVLDADPARTYFYLTGKQSTNLASTNSTTVKNFRFGLPPISEQSRIVEYLSVKTRQIDDLVDKARAVAAVLRERRSALISAAVTGKINVTTEGVTA
jgi:type I restriction enzyme S subunit